MRQLHVISSLTLLAAFLVLAAVGNGGAAITPAGSQIISQSSAQYAAAGNAESTSSNFASNLVSPVYGVTLTPSGSVAAPAYNLQGYEGDTLYADFVVSNVGNDVDSIDVVTGTIAPSTISPQTIVFYDADGNGRFDAGEDNRAFLSLALGGSTPLTLGFVLTPGIGGGDAFVELATASTADSIPVVATSVVRVTSLGTAAGTLHLGPNRNAQALPGGEGSGNDVTRIAVGYQDLQVTFRNDVLNTSGLSDFALLELDSIPLPPPLSVSFSDTMGNQLTISPANPNAVNLGAISSGETRTVLTTISSPVPLYSVLADSLSLGLLVTSTVDSMRVNRTSDVVMVPRRFNPDGLLELQQTFRENIAALGDVVTLVVTVHNTHDSVRVDNVVVTEDAQPALDFLSSRRFVDTGGGLRWDVGSLAPGEARETTIRFLVNGRVMRGETKVFGRASGVAVSGQLVATEPVANLLRIDNDVFGDEGLVFGSVFVDDNENAVRDEGEPGAAGVALYMESGEFAVTDSLGKFSIPRVFSGYRTVRLDPGTLPAEVRLARDDDDGSRLLHMLPSGHAQVLYPLRRLETVVDSVERSVQAQTLTTMQKAERVVYTLPSVPSSYFTLGKAFVKNEHLYKLKPIQDFLFANPGWLVFLHGHTDSLPINTPEFPSNQELSVARAEALMRYLVVNGVERSRIRVHGYGDEQPVASNATPAGRAQNRRVEVSFVPQELRDADEHVIRERQQEIRNMATLPDSFMVRAQWNVSTNSIEPVDVSASIAGPPAGHLRTTVTLDGVPADTSRIVGFKKGKPVRITVEGMVAAPDTQSVRNLHAVLRIGGTELATTNGARRLDAFANTVSQDKTLWRWKIPVDAEMVLIPVPTASDSDSSAAGGVEFGFRSPATGDLFSRRDRITVAVRLPLGSRYELFANDELVSEDRIGKKELRAKIRVEDVTFYGVQLAAGWNSLRIHATGVRGEEYSDTVSVALAGHPTAMKAAVQRLLVYANGVACDSLRIAVLDPVGLPVRDGIIATVVDESGVLGNRDLLPDRRHLQVSTRDGYIPLRLLPSTETGVHRLTIRCEGLEETVVVSYVSPRRPMFITGLLQGLVGVFNKTGDADPLGIEHFEDGVSAEGDSRFFMQGTTYWGMNLTARVDSRARYKDPVLKALNPDRGYGIYGDSSELYFAAPSEGGNYLALEKGEGFLRYGDFRTAFEDGEFLKFKRTATGLTSALVSRDNSINAFVTKTDFKTVRDEIPGDGTSGFYYLSESPVVENSVTITLETRDRFQPERVLEVRPLVLNRDYTVNYFSGAVLFKEPIPERSVGFHPTTIVFIYEVETGEPSDYVYGVRSELAKTGRYELGATVVAKGDDEVSYALYGVNGSLDLSKLRVSGEVARSDDDFLGDGMAYKIEADVNTARLSHSMYLREVDRDFNNPSFTGASHELFSKKFGYDTRVALGDRLSLESHGYRHELDRTDETRETITALGILDNDAWRLSAGVRAAGQQELGSDRNGVLSVLGVGGQRAGVEFDSRWENNLGSETVDDYPDRLKSRLAAPIFDRLKAVVTHEYLASDDRAATHRFLAGLESQLTEGTTLYSRYSMNRTGSDERLGAVSGVRQRFLVSDRVTATAELEGFRSFSDSSEEEYVALKTGVNWANHSTSSVESKYEYRWQRALSRHLIRWNALRQFNDGLSVVFRNALSVTEPDSRRTAVASDGRLAGVYRPEHSRFKTMVMLKNEYERFSPADVDAITWRLVISNDINLHPAAAHEVRLKLAYKRVEDFSVGVSSTTNNHLVLSQYVFHFAPKWDMDLWGRYVGQNGIGTDRFGAGVEVGRTLYGRVRVAAGYSINGFEDRDFSRASAWARGFGLRAQIILGDWILNELGF